MEKVSGSLVQNMDYMNRVLGVEQNFDVVHRMMSIGTRNACMYLIDGFCKDDLIQKLLQYFMDMKPEDVPENAGCLVHSYIPHVEVTLETDYAKLLVALLSGMFVLFVEGYQEAILVDSRTYPARSVEEPSKDRALRGSKDGFVETIVYNTALIRRRIRSEKLRMELLNAGECSHTDIVLCYMDDRVDKEYLKELREKINGIQAEALTMNQESLAEAIYQRKWFNPFPKFKYTERPDAAAAQILEGNIVVLVDTSPSAMVIPTTIFDVIDEADDYYFPPITGTYLRLTRFMIAVLTYLMTPTFLLLMNQPWLVPAGLEFIMLKEPPNVPLIWQFLILELAIDGLKLASISTPNMLSTPLSVMAALVLGEFSVNSGWFSSEVMLYMAFVAIANYTQSNFELGYALKFLRILHLILTAIFGLYGYVAGIVIAVLSIFLNRTVSHKSYTYPLLPFCGRKLANILLRKRLPGAMEHKSEQKKSV